MRGKGSNYMQESDVSGITPAYAGKSDPKVLGIGNAEDHPRLCGEKQVEMVDADTLRGSPPPMRGKVNFFKFFWCLARITPAYAGKRLGIGNAD